MLASCRRAAVGLAVWLASASWAVAQSVASQSPDAWPSFTGLYPTSPLDFQRGPGFYLSWFRLLLAWLVFLAWVRTSDWVNRDVQNLKGNYARWNSITCFSFFAALLLVFYVPWFWASLPLLLVAWGAPFGLYVYQRNAKLDETERMLTKAHLLDWASASLGRLGIKVNLGPKGPAAPLINFTPRGGKTDRDNAANLLKARQTPGFAYAGDLLVKALESRASAVMIDLSPTAAVVRQQVDGVWAPAPGRDPKSADAMYTTFKTLAALNPAERMARQRGAFGAEHQKTKYTCRLLFQGSKAGERLTLNLDDGMTAKITLASAGMSEKMQADLKAVLGQKQGFVVVSAPPGGGLTTAVCAVASGIDRFMRSAMAVEEAGLGEMKVENVPVTTFEPGQTAAAVLPGVARQYPDAIVVSELADAQTVAFLCEQVAEDRLIIGGIRAKDAAETLLRVLMLKVPLKKFVPVVTCVVNQRLVRKLCTTCKEAYATPPQVAPQLAALGHKPKELYRPPTPTVAKKAKGKEPPVCPDCKGVGYRGRTGIFEMIVVNDLVRNTLLKQPQLEAVRQAARKAGMRSLQEEGAGLVAQGVTSLQELTRALKEFDKPKGQ